MKPRSRFLAAALLLGSAIPVCTAQDAPAQSFSGAVFTTNAGCVAVNGNIYDTKMDVYLDGGPVKQGPALPSNQMFYVQVTAPDGTVLGSSLTNTNQRPVVTDSAGTVSGCLQLYSIVSQSQTVPGFADTPNPGGEYKVWVSLTSDFNPNTSKTDNFKVRTSNPAPGQGSIIVKKFYDANTDGIQNDITKEPYINGWLVTLMKEGMLIKQTPATYTDLAVAGGVTYTVQEYQPIQNNWVSTRPAPVNAETPYYLNQTTVNLSPNYLSETVLFGNVCTGAGGGSTLGYWSNKNGQETINKAGWDTIFDGLTAKNLVNADGTPFDPVSHDQLRAWLLGGNAVNMAYMLSVQYAAMYMNVNAKPNGSAVKKDALVYAPGVPHANPAGFITIDKLMDAANDALGLNRVVLAGHLKRTEMEAIKDALDRANNNRNFVQSDPRQCPYSFPDLPSALP